ncbi:unnamed protein product [Symbiodinium sp. CCMP2592]|nr:unnamed protein product [Symbiodinium sp. CCMP2592]
MNDPTVVGLYSMWQDGRLHDEDITRRGGVALLRFLRTVAQGLPEDTLAEQPAVSIAETLPASQQETIPFVCAGPRPSLMSCTSRVAGDGRRRSSFAFDAGQATGPFECGRDEYGPKLCQGAFNSSFDVGMHNGSVTQAFEWDTYGYFVGCNVLGHFPFPNYKIYYPNAVWYSLPGPCPSRNYTQWDDKCRERQPGGYCDQTPTGQGNCTWTYEDAGEITIDELTDIRNYTSFLESGRQEYMRWADRGKGWTWWDSKRDELANEWRLMLAEELFAKKYPNATPASEIPDPKCDFNMRRFYEDKGYYATECHTAQKGERCYKDVIWAKHDGIWKHPEWYKGLTPSSTFEEFQAYLYRTSPIGSPCPPPCT